ncbi:tripartite motif-containing protein 2-like [Branchiostoma lanceolatum]|uniref:tripartite motif-containing protein 2-like n=1 Tax=Branchiostoma lanceolatum TaxID=7740 RepID=UPI0034533503
MPLTEAAENVPREEFDEKSLTCPVCKDNFDNPRVLPCLHTFCAGCLELLRWQKGKIQFTCPTCWHQVSLQGQDVTSLPVNFYINNLLDFRALQKSEETHNHCQACKSGVSWVEGTCADCRRQLCKNCITAHGNIPALKDHYIITLDDLKNPSSRQKYTPTQYCPKHTDQRMTFYCLPCAKLVCQACTVDEHRPGPDHDPQEVGKVAQKYNAELQTLVGQTLDTAEALKKTTEAVGDKLTSITTNCELQRTKIQEYFTQLRAKLDEAEQKVTVKLDRMEQDQKEPLLKDKAGLEKTLRSTEEGLQFCTDVLARSNPVEILTLRQQLQNRLKSLTATKISHRALDKDISFQPNLEILTCTPGSLSLVKAGITGGGGGATWGGATGGGGGATGGGGGATGGGGNLCFPLTVDVGSNNPVLKGFPVESLPTTVIFRPQEGQVQGTPLVTVTSPGGQHATLDTTETSEGVFEAVWRPQTSGKHVVGVTTGGGDGATRVVVGGRVIFKREGGRTTGRGGGATGGGGNLCSPLTVDVGSNNPVLRFGQKGSQQGQFNKPVDVAVRGDRLYVADTYNKRVQVFDLNGNFCDSFTTTANAYSLTVLTDGTIVVETGKEVIKKFSPSGKLIKKFPLGKYSTNPYGLAVQRDGRVVVADLDKHSIFLFEVAGTLVKQVGGKGQGEGQFIKPSFVCVDKEDNIIVSDKDNHRVQVFDKNLNFKQKFGQKGKQPQGMWAPQGVSADSRGNIVLANLGDKSRISGVEHGRKLQVFGPDGTWVATISSDGDKLRRPHGLAVTEDGHVFVTDTEDNCIRKYRYM